MKKISAMLCMLAALGALSVAPAVSQAQGTQAAQPAQAATISLRTQGLIEACMGCHGIAHYKASFPEVYRVPKIGGQNERYIEAALQAYRSGARKHPTMRGVAGSLTDKDITELAAYYAAQNAAR